MKAIITLHLSSSGKYEGAVIRPRGQRYMGKIALREKDN